jgi:tRNA A-37 threonylcarbamoyl transferase component Bud32
MKENGKTADLFAAALEINTGERARFLSAECGADTDLRREVEDLVNAYKIAETDGFLQSSALEIEAANFESEDADARIDQTLGRYKIVERIGSGGMGAIYLAVREDGEFQKRAAVKIIKRGMDTEAILRRFRSERQILARLEHPNIARLLDGGTTADGLPYLVMEYVEGAPIDEYCRRNNLPEREKIELFRIVCAAVAFAHRNLIVHRDLKPSNVLVTKDGEPKLLDFGIAKLLDETEFATQTHLRVLTPAYASPEQAAGENVTTATDVYSLGVVLHELLTGIRPFSTGATNNEPRKTSQKLKGELSNIVAKALRREPERRYSSIEIFSDDLRRYLEGLPVSARADTVFYRAGKFVGRNKVLVSAAVFVFLLFVFGVAAIAWQARVAQIERARAERRAENLQFIRRRTSRRDYQFARKLARPQITFDARRRTVRRARRRI